MNETAPQDETPPLRFSRDTHWSDRLRCMPFALLCFAVAGSGVTAMLGWVETGLTYAFQVLGGALVFGVSLATAVSVLNRSARITAVVLDARGLTVEEGKNKTRYGWRNFGSALREGDRYQQVAVLCLYDPQGQLLLKVPHKLDDIETCWAMIEAKVAQHGEDASPPETTPIEKRDTVIMTLGFFVLLGVLGWGGLMLGSILGELKQLRDDGMTGRAEIVDMYTSDDKQTGYIEFRVIEGDTLGPVVKDTVEPEDWMAMLERDVVDVIYLPEDLSVGQLNEGHSAPDFKALSITNYLIWGAPAVGMFIFGGVIVSRWLGMKPNIWIRLIARVLPDRG